MIRNIKKRKELAQMVYNRYGDQFASLTKEDKKDLEMEIGAAFEGYEMALKDVAKMIEKGKNISDMMKFITMTVF